MIPKDYKLAIGLGKALRTALFSVLTLLLASGGVEVFFDTLTTGIGSLGFPVWVIPVIIAVINFGRNFLKQWLASKVPPPAQ